MNYKCPACGASYYAIQYYVSTLVGYQRIFKNGEEITKDPNHHMMYCQCLNCGNYFAVELNKESDVYV